MFWAVSFIETNSFPFQVDTAIGIYTHRCFIADDKSVGLHSGWYHHLGSFDCDDALEAGVAHLRMGQILHFENNFFRNVVGQ